MSLELRYSLPNQPEQVVPIVGNRIMFGTLPSNDVVIRAPGVDPIHAMIEIDDQGRPTLTDLGSQSGLKVNFKDLDVEAVLKAGDVIILGAININVVEAKKPAVIPNYSEPIQPEADEEEIKPRRATTTVQSSSSRDERRVEKRDLLFSPRKARPSGNVLEVVCYWGDTIIDVDLFHPSFKGYERVTIGVPPKAHFIAGGDEDVSSHPFADVTEEGYRLRLLPGMDARIRKGGEVFAKTGDAKISLGRRDVAHISHGAIRYFLMFVTPPPLALPPRRARDPVFATLMTISMLFYFVTMPLIWRATPKNEDDKLADVWAPVNLPEVTPPEEKKPEPKQKPPEPPKPPVKVAEVKPKEPEKPKPPPEPPKPVKPVKPVEVEKVKQPKPVETPKPKVAIAPPSKESAETKAENPAEKKQEEQKMAGPPSPPNPDKSKAPGAAGPKAPAGAPGKPSLDKLNNAGMASTQTKRPDFKMAGPVNARPLGPAGGDVGAGMNAAGAQRKGNETASQMGVEGPKNNKASGVNLDKLGLSAGKILDKTGPGAIATPFKNSAGGAGGGSGSAGKTLGLGGVGAGSSLGVAGSGSAMNNFGGGSGGFGGGQGGSGGLGGLGGGLGTGFGSKGGGGGGGAGGAGGRASVNIPPGDPVVSGGLTAQEVQAVIKANLNQIRHCYEQLLQRSPNASGKVKVSFTVGTDGRVTRSSLAGGSTLGDSVMQGCVVGKVQRWKFPSPRGGQPVEVTYPFVFNPV